MEEANARRLKIIQRHFDGIQDYPDDADQFVVARPTAPDVWEVTFKLPEEKVVTITFPRDFPFKQPIYDFHFQVSPSLYSLMKQKKEWKPDVVMRQQLYKLFLLLCDDKNNNQSYTIVYVWSPKKGDYTSTMDVSQLVRLLNDNSTGHVSMSMVVNGKEEYVSFWPSRAVSNSTETVDGNFYSAGRDYSSMGGSYEFSFVFFSLDVPAMVSALRAFRSSSSPPRYRLRGRDINTGEGDHNCASLVYDLMLFGGMEHLLAAEKVNFFWNPLRSTGVLTPISLRVLLYKAKLQEVHHFQVSNTTQPDVLDHNDDGAAISLIYNRYYINY